MQRYPDVNLVFGPDAVPNISTLLSATQNQKQVLDTNFLDEADYVFAADLDPTATERIGAFVTIQKGCDNKCTFCIVPTTRGKELSRPSQEIVAEVRALAAQGIKEITLIGQNVNSYGLKSVGEKTFAQLLYAVADVKGVERIRYTTSHPRDMGPDVIQAYRDIPQLCSHLHLPVQSGSNKILRRMKRFYNRSRYLDVVAQLRDARPDISLSTDFIVGFPGETEEDFAQTMSLLEEVRFHSSFSFKYSERPGTPALKLASKYPVDSIRAGSWLMTLQKRQREIAQEENGLLEGKVLSVLIEGPSRHDEGIICGRTHTFKTINFPGDPSWVGQTRNVRVIKAFANSLRGELVNV